MSLDLNPVAQTGTAAPRIPSHREAAGGLTTSALPERTGIWATFANRNAFRPFRFHGNASVRAKASLTVLMVMIGASASVFGQGSAGTGSPPPKVFTIHPAAEPIPALRYRFLPERRDLIAGNAAVFYHRAIESLLQKRSYAQAAQNQVEGKIYEWMNLPLRDVPREEARKQLDIYRYVLHEIEVGTRREFCNWEFDRRDEGFDLLLQDIQETRSLARLIVLKARIEILDGHNLEAIHWLEVGFTLSRHVAQGNSIIQSLIGAAISSSMMGALEDLIQAPGAPNLYWAIAGLPRPCIDFTPGYEGERYMLEREIPGLRELDSDPWGLERAQKFSQELQSKLGMLSESWGAIAGDAGAPSIKDWGKQLVMTSLVARSYPEAKRYLIAAGRSAAQVEAMPTIQVVALYSLKMYNRARDEFAKWTLLPYPQAYKGMHEALRGLAASSQKAKQGLPFELLLPSLQSAIVASVRVDRRLNAIQGIEAIRLYAEAHGGELPPSLEAITQAPVPLDPATGKPFEYKVDGSTAMLSAPAIPGEAPVEMNMIRYELKLVK